MRPVLENSHPQLSLTHHLGPVQFTTVTVRRGVLTRHRRSWFASFPPFSHNDQLTVLREGLFFPLEKIP